MAYRHALWLHLPTVYNTRQVKANSSLPRGPIIKITAITSLSSFSLKYPEASLPLSLPSAMTSKINRPLWPNHGVLLELPKEDISILVTSKHWILGEHFYSCWSPTNHGSKGSMAPKLMWVCMYGCVCKIKMWDFYKPLVFTNDSTSL